MIVDSSQRVVSIQRRRLITLLSVVAVALTLFLLGTIPDFLGLTRIYWGIIILLIYALSIIAESLMQYTFIYYDDTTDNIILRFFSLGLLNKRKQSIEIPKAEFSSFLLREELFGYRKKIILRRYYKNIEAKYPPLSLTILSKEQYAMLLMSLERITKSKKE